MIYAGEDPRFIIRRLIILAGEDIGLADPMGLIVASSAAQAFDFIGLPEGIYPIVEATLYLATAPKSNSAGAYFSAMKRSRTRDKSPCRATSGRQPRRRREWDMGKIMCIRTTMKVTSRRNNICQRDCWERISIPRHKKATKRK
ncbi:MAG: hypothetical protein U0X93_01110 [Anaerolineales bacterium]